jgi:phosphatidylserine/phosphatidylglycerophosphate/cardiolipin synthase-like enzyme
MPQKVGDVELYMGPTEVGGPDDLKKAVLDFINGARRRLDIAVQELDSTDIAKAIIKARQRKVQVRLVVEGDYLRARQVAEDPWESGGEYEVNRAIQNAILRTAINIRSDYNPQIFHQKFIVRDGSAVLTGSTNFTDTGTSRNLNPLVIVRSRKVANLYSREYREIQQGHFGKLNEGHDPKPADVEVSNVPIRVAFAPDHNPEMEIMKQMLKARKSVYFAVFTFSQSSGIDDTLLQLHSAKIKIRGLVDGRMSSQKWAANHILKKAKIDVRTVPSQHVPGGGRLGKLHHKLMVIDEQVIVAGSFNYTGPATRLNDENVIILGDLESTKQGSVNAQRRLATYALDEIERIREDFSQEIT